MDKVKGGKVDVKELKRLKKEKKAAKEAKLLAKLEQRKNLLEAAKPVQKNLMKSGQVLKSLGREYTASVQRVGFFNIGSGRVLDKILGSGSGSGRVGVSKNTIGYFRYLFFFRVFSGKSGYVGYFRVFLGLPIYTRVF